MNKTIIQIRELSLKDALDLIPRFNGQNISLIQFLDGSQEVLSILPKEYDTELAKLNRMRLYGDALNSVRRQNFKEISEISEFLETINGSAKTEQSGFNSNNFKGKTDQVKIMGRIMDNIYRQKIL